MWLLEWLSVEGHKIPYHNNSGTVKPAPNMYSQFQAWPNVQDQVVTGFDFIIINITIIICIKLVKPCKFMPTLHLIGWAGETTA